MTSLREEIKTLLQTYREASSGKFPNPNPSLDVDTIYTNKVISVFEKHLKELLK